MRQAVSSYRAWSETDLLYVSHPPSRDNGGKGVSTYLIADEMGMSRQGVDRLRNKALERLRRACRDKPGLAQTLEEVCMELS